MRLTASNVEDSVRQKKLKLEETNLPLIASDCLATKYMLEMCVEDGVPACAHDIFSICLSHGLTEKLQRHSFTPRKILPISCGHLEKS